MTSQNRKSAILETPQTKIDKRNSSQGAQRGLISISSTKGFDGRTDTCGARDPQTGVLKCRKCGIHQGATLKVDPKIILISILEYIFQTATKMMFSGFR